MSKILTAAFACAILSAQPSRAAVDATPSPYPNMAPRDQYLIADRAEEIALARSAAVPSIADNAGVMVLGPHGYETAVKGTNGFVCIVERAWDKPFDDPEFWNPKMRAPDCLNAAAASTVLPTQDENAIGLERRCYGSNRERDYM